MDWIKKKTKAHWSFFFVKTMKNCISNTASEIVNDGKTGTIAFFQTHSDGVSGTNS